MSAPQESHGAIAFLGGSELLGKLFRRRATGQLVVYGDAVRKVYLKSGAVLHATSSLPAERLADVLLSHGSITREQYDESAAYAAATGRPQATALVRIDALSAQELFRGLITQVREIVLAVCTLDDGRWRFFEGQPPPDELVCLRLPAPGLIAEGLLRTAADPRWTGRWEPRRLGLVPAGTPPFASDPPRLPEKALRLLRHLEQGHPFDEAARRAGCERREATALSYAMALLGLLRLGAAARETAPPAPPQAPVAPPAAAPTRAPDPALRALREKVLALAARLGALSHYQLLGVEPGADDEVVKRAYMALAREYHPDRFFRPECEDLQEPANAIFVRVNEAFTTLRNPAARAEYDRAALRSSAPVARALGREEDSTLARAQFNRGIGLLNAGEFWAAIQALRWAVSLAPENPRYHTFLGVALTRTKKRLHEAEEHCKTAIALDFSNAQYYVNLGQVYRTGHLFEKARRQFEKALKLDPRHAGALKELRAMDADGPPKDGRSGRRR